MRNDDGGMARDQLRESWRTRAARRLDALALAWSTPGTARRFLVWLAAATALCLAITLAFAAVSASLRDVVTQAARQHPQVTETVVPMLRRRFDFGAVFVLLALIAAPVIETVLIAVGASLAREHGWSPRRTVLTAGAVFGLLHASNGLLAIVPAAVMFVVLTASYLRWRPVSLELAFLAAALPHLAANALVVAARVVQAAAS